MTLVKEKNQEYLIPFIGILLSFLVCSILLIAYGVNPLLAYGAMFKGVLGSKNGISETVGVSIPLILTSIGIALGQKAKIFNIGAEGQIYMGALGATIVGIKLSEYQPYIVIPLVILAGFIFGMIWILIPALLKAYYNVNEIVMTVMLNEVAIFLVSYLIRNPLKDPESSMPHSAMIGESAYFPSLIKGTKIHLGFFIALIVVVLFWFILNKTTFGFQINAVGESLQASKYAGISSVKTMIIVLLLSGGLAGIAGAGEVSGIHHRLIDNISPQYGYLSIIVALLGRKNPVIITIAAIFFASLLVGASAMQRSVGIPVALAYIIQAVTVLFVICSEQIVNYFRNRVLKVRIKQSI